MKRNRSCLLSNRTSRWPLPGTRSSDPPVCSQSGPWCGWMRGGYLLNCILCSWASLHLNSCAENTSTFTKVISSRRKSCNDVLIALFYMAQQIQPIPRGAANFDIFCFFYMMLIGLVFNLQLVSHYSCCLPISLLCFIPLSN